MPKKKRARRYVPGEPRPRHLPSYRTHDDVVKIAYGAIPNPAPSGGYLPAVWVNGQHQGASWGRGQDRAKACAVAQAQAHDTASRYRGDWRVNVIAGCARGRSAAVEDRINRAHWRKGR